MNIILTGVPGIGKTTVVERIIEALGSSTGGMITREIRQSGRRTGFAIESLDGHRQVLASKEKREGPKVGPYTVLISNLEDVGVVAIERAIRQKEVVVIDEIGKMEVISARFRDMVLESLDSSIHTLATIGVSKAPFFETIRRRSDVRLIQVTMENRDSLPGQIVNLLERPK